MTTIRAHVPVETPAGLMVALPPCGQSLCRDGCTCLPAPPDVFALAVPCSYETATAPETGHTCDGYVHHGDYRVLDVMPIVDANTPDGRRHWKQHVIKMVHQTAVLERHTDHGTWDSWQSYVIDLPAAVPGGVALVVEPIEPK
jgi:hypothetical protein